MIDGIDAKDERQISYSVIMMDISEYEDIHKYQSIWLLLVALYTVNHTHYVHINGMNTA